MELKSRIISLLILWASIILIGCSNSKKQFEPADSEEANDEIIDSQQAYSVDTPKVQPQNDKDIETNNKLSINLESVAKMPPYYEKGYDAGYDDGEEDAVNGNGYQASFDDSNHYKGKKKSQYEDGYLEGYEAGYDDNNEGYE